MYSLGRMALARLLIEPDIPDTPGAHLWPKFHGHVWRLQPTSVFDVPGYLGARVRDGYQYQNLFDIPTFPYRTFTSVSAPTRQHCRAGESAPFDVPV